MMTRENKVSRSSHLQGGIRPNDSRLNRGIVLGRLPVQNGGRTAECLHVVFDLLLQIVDVISNQSGIT